MLITIETHQIKQLAEAYRKLGNDGMVVPLRRALNKIGDKAYTQIVRTVALESGAQQKRVRHILRKVPATMSLQWRAVARDGYMSLKDFSPRQTSKGVKHKAWGGGMATGAFIVESLGGHVYKRTGGAKRVMIRGKQKGQRREPIEKLWGPALPVQMIRGKTEQVIQVIVERDFIPEALRLVQLEFVRLASAKITGG